MRHGAGAPPIGSDQAPPQKKGPLPFWTGQRAGKERPQVKIDAISTHERALIISHLKVHEKWEATRLGAEVCIVKIRTQDRKTQIHYSVEHRSHADAVRRSAGIRETVGDAVVAINEAIALKPRPPRPLPSSCSHLRPAWMESDYRLPYKDADLLEAEL